MVTSRRWSDELSTKLKLWLVDQGDQEGDDDTTMFVWAKDAEEAHRLWSASARLWNWPIGDGGAYVRQVPVDKPKLPSVVEWNKVTYYYVYVGANGEYVTLYRTTAVDAYQRKRDYPNYPKG